VTLAGEVFDRLFSPLSGVTNASCASFVGSLPPNEVSFGHRLRIREELLRSTSNRHLVGRAPDLRLMFVVAVRIIGNPGSLGGAVPEISRNTLLR
jgi:hypothetical protein